MRVGWFLCDGGEAIHSRQDGGSVGRIDACQLVRRQQLGSRPSRCGGAARGIAYERSSQPRYLKWELRLVLQPFHNEGGTNN